jgi:hypothetical protein
VLLLPCCTEQQLHEDPGQKAHLLSARLAAAVLAQRVLLLLLRWLLLLCRPVNLTCS